MNDFLIKMEDALSRPQGTVKAGDKFRSYSEWSSLSLLMVMSMINDDFGITISRLEFEKLQTVNELFDFIQQKI